MTPDPSCVRSVLSDGSTCTVSLCGEVDLACEDELVGVVRTFTRSDLANVVVDLSDVTFMDSTGIRALLALAAQASARSGRIELRGVPGQIGRVLDLTGVSGVLGEGRAPGTRVVDPSGAGPEVG